jgi:3-oxoacyl-[acyl-carrier-protein] synthase II
MAASGAEMLARAGFFCERPAVPTTPHLLLRRVAVTALGVVSPLGSGAAENLAALRAGRDGVRPVSDFDVTRCRAKTAFPVTGLPVSEELHPASLMMIAAARELQAGDPGFIPEMAVIGTTSGGMSFGERYYRALIARERPSRRARWLANYLPQKAVLDAQQACGFSCPAQIIANACASGSNAVGHAFQLVRAGKFQRVLCGGYDALSELVYVGFDSLQAATPEKIRPFDKNRTGLVLGEGAALLALEDWESAMQRGATILAEITGYGISTDNHHLTQPHPSGVGPRLAMERALADAQREPGDVDYINAHGTGTAFNDATEGAAIAQLFGSRVPVSSTKSMMGHSLGAAGAIEAVFCILALRGGFLPPNINYTEADPAWALNIVANESRAAELRCVVSNSFGFGGTNASLVIERVAEVSPTQSRRMPKRSAGGIRIAGCAWVTPQGTSLAEVWPRVERGELAKPQPLLNPENGRELSYLPVPLKSVEAIGRQPRLRRSSAISYFAVAAGLAAIEHAGLAVTPEFAAGTALIFAIGDGGVVYTRRFYEQIVKQGANAASPLLFPETVHNAPASHLAAQLGIDGPSYTLVGDATVGLTALKLAEQLLDLGAVERCVVVGCEELDWVLCEAYRDWRLAASPSDPTRGALLAEGAAALVVTREGSRAGLSIHDGVPFFRRNEAAPALATVLSELIKGGPLDAIMSCGNGTFIDQAEASALAKLGCNAPLHFPKRTFGEAIGASALLQIVAATCAIEVGGAQRVLVPVLGWNQQASGAVVFR